MKHAAIFSAAMILNVCACLTAYGRGAVPPPPPFSGGNVGSWLGSGPLFGFDTPWGADFPDDWSDGSSGGGNGSGSGFEWNPSDGPGGGVSTDCATCKCRRYIPGIQKCKGYCWCVILGEEEFRPGTLVPGKCRKYDDEDPNAVCCHPREDCLARW